MKIFTLSLLIVFLCTFCCFGQKGGKGAATPAAAPGNSASSSTQLIQGFHYKLKPKFHLRYKSITVGKWPNGVTHDPTNIQITDANIKYDLPLKNKKKGVIENLPPTSKYAGKKHLAENVSFQDNTLLNPKDKREDTRDTIWRYSPYKQRVSVTQGDSGKLAIQFFSINAKEYVSKNKSTNRSLTHIDLNDIDVAYYADGKSNAAISVMNTDSAQNFYLQIKSTVYISDKTYFISLPYSVVQYGATTIPFRYRFGNPNKKISLPNASKVLTDYNVPSEASANISLAAYIGKKFGSTRFFYDPTKSHNTASFMVSAFVGPTLIPLSANNISSGSDINQYPSQLLAISYGVSATFELGALNWGFFGGLDQPLQSSPWVYAGRPWIGFGFGFNLGMLTSAGTTSR